MSVIPEARRELAKTPSPSDQSIAHASPFWNLISRLLLLRRQRRPHLALPHARELVAPARPKRQRESARARARARGRQNTRPRGERARARRARARARGARLHSSWRPTRISMPRHAARSWRSAAANTGSLGERERARRRRESVLRRSRPRPARARPARASRRARARAATLAAAAAEVNEHAARLLQRAVLALDLQEVRRERAEVDLAVDQRRRLVLVRLALAARRHLAGGLGQVLEQGVELATRRHRRRLGHLGEPRRELRRERRGRRRRGGGQARHRRPVLLDGLASSAIALRHRAYQFLVLDQVRILSTVCASPDRRARPRLLPCRSWTESRRWRRAGCATRRGSRIAS